MKTFPELILMSTDCAEGAWANMKPHEEALIGALLSQTYAIQALAVAVNSSNEAREKAAQIFKIPELTDTDREQLEQRAREFHAGNIMVMEPPTVELDWETAWKHYENAILAIAQQYGTIPLDVVALGSRYGNEDRSPELWQAMMAVGREEPKDGEMDVCRHCGQEIKHTERGWGHISTTVICRGAEPEP